MNAKKLLFCLPLAAFAAQAPAQSAGPLAGYAGFTVGQAKVDDLCDGFEGSCDDSSLSFRVHGGAELSSFANLELGYRYVDDVEASGVVSGIGVAAAINGHFVDTTLQLGLPESGPFKFFTKAGLMLWRLNYEVAASNGWMTVSEEDDDTGVAFRTGLGMSYQVSDQLRLRADWDLLLNVGDDDETGEADINIFSVGPEFRF